MVFEELSCVDYGDTSVVPGYIEDSYARITAGIAPILAAGAIPIGIGGDHSITLAELRAVAAKHGPVALVQFDSHGDTWDEYFGRKYNHGTPFRRAAEEGLIDPRRSFQAGMRGSLYGPSDYQDAREMGFTLWPMEEVRRQGWEATHAAIRAGRRQRPGLPHLRHRLRGPDLRAGHRHAGSRRPDLVGGVAGGARPGGLGDRRGGLRRGPARLRPDADDGDARRERHL